MIKSTMKRKKTQVTVTLTALVLMLAGLAGCGKIYEEEELPNSFVLPAGTEIVVTPVENLSDQELMPGTEFAGILETPLYYERERLDPNGTIYTENTLIAPQGAPVYGTVVPRFEPLDPGEERTEMGLRLTKVTLHGGTSFDIETEPLFKFKKEEGEMTRVSTASEDSVLTFKLAQPADVALVIELRDKEDEKEKDTNVPPLPPTAPMIPPATL